MANPLPFQPAIADPKTELQRRLAEAPVQHAEALLVVWDILGTAHDEGLLDALHGLVGARDTVFAKLTEYAKTPEGITALRNLFIAAKLLSNVDPEVLNGLSKSIEGASQQCRAEKKPPSLWRLFRRFRSKDGRRGLSFVTLVLTGLGRSVKRG